MENFIFDDDDLIWYIDPNDVYRRLYVSKSLETDIFVMIHDRFHSRVNKDEGRNGRSVDLYL